LVNYILSIHDARLEKYQVVIRSDFGLCG